MEMLFTLFSMNHTAKGLFESSTGTREKNGDEKEEDTFLKWSGM